MLVTRQDLDITGSPLSWAANLASLVSLSPLIHKQMHTFVFGKKRQFLQTAPNKAVGRDFWKERLLLHFSDVFFWHF